MLLNEDCIMCLSSPESRLRYVLTLVEYRALQARRALAEHDLKYARAHEFAAAYLENAEKAALELAVDEFIMQMHCEMNDAKRAKHAMHVESCASSEVTA